MKAGPSLVGVFCWNRKAATVSRETEIGITPLAEKICSQELFLEGWQTCWNQEYGFHRPTQCDRLLLCQTRIWCPQAAALDSQQDSGQTQTEPKLHGSPANQVSSLGTFFLFVLLLKSTNVEQAVFLTDTQFRDVLTLLCSASPCSGELYTFNLRNFGKADEVVKLCNSRVKPSLCNIALAIEAYNSNE